MTESEPKQGDSRWSAVFIVAIVAIVLPFLPLLCSGLEYLIFGSHNVEEFFRRVGLHEKLGRINRPLIEFFRRLRPVP